MHEICSVDSQENCKNCCHQLSDFKVKMHHIRFRLGLRPRSRWGILQRSPRPPSWIKEGGLFLREGRERVGKRGREGREGILLSPPPHISTQIYAPAELEVGMLSVISNFREASVHFLICSASPHDVVLNASGPSVHFPGAFAKFQDNVRGAEAFGTTRGRCRRCGCRDDLRTTTRTRCRRCAEVHFRIQILLSTKILRRKLFDVRNVRKYPEWFRNDKNSVQIKT